ncbi:MAG: AAA family ATPase [Candidatus Omnitrophica bacterium]|nr:AAA family ATPase [Candidatus Omnitrophota bacterium]
MAKDKRNVKRLFIAATMQNDGKTTIALGLISALRRRFKKIGFIKPVGQRYLLEDGYKVDEDSVLMEKVFGYRCCIKDMNPIAVERGFTERYILRGKKESLEKRIFRAFEKLSQDQDNDLIIIEGTGHAGVGSCFDLSNARVAKMLEAPVILISSGGVGKPIDEILLNNALFEREGIEILGVVINKVLREKYKKVRRLVSLGLRKKGIELLGVVPYNKMLTAPTVRQIAEELRLKFLNSSGNLDNLVKKIVVGAMEPHEALNYFEDGSLIITPGDREDIILSAMSFHLTGRERGKVISGVLLTGNLMPHRRILRLLRLAKIPLLISPEDTYAVASRIHDLTVKLRPEDKEKIKQVRNLIERYIDIDKIFAFLKE